MVILGLNYYFHDSTACIVKDGVLIAAIEEERLNRDKHTRKFPMLAIARCLKMAGLEYDDIDHIAVSIKPTHNLGKKIIHSLTHLKTIKPFVNHELVQAYNKQKKWLLFYIRYDLLFYRYAVYFMTLISIFDTKYLKATYGER